MPFSSTSVEPELQPAIELAFEAAGRELRLTPGRILSSHQKAVEAPGLRLDAIKGGGGPGLGQSS